MKDYDKNKESSYLQYLDENNLYGWAMSQKLPVNNFEWIKDFSQFNENFIEGYNKEIDERYFLEVDVQYPKIIYELQYIQQSFSKNICNKNEKKKNRSTYE